MKNIITFITLSICVNLTFGQTVGNSKLKITQINDSLNQYHNINEFNQRTNSISNNFNKIEKVTLLTDNGGKSLSMDKLINILNLEVAEYFDLIDKNASELEKNVFIEKTKASSEYQKYLSDLKKIRANVLNTPMLLNIKSHCFYKDKYNVEKKSFPYQNSTVSDRFLSKEYIQIGEEFNNICIGIPSEFTVESGYIGNNYDYLTQRYYVPVYSQEDALKIEKNCSNMTLFMVLRIKETKIKKHSYGFNMNFVMADLVSYFYVEDNSGKIIYKKLKK